MMNLTTISEELGNLIAAGKIRLAEPMKQHTSFKVGGPADLFLMPDSEEEIHRIIQYFSNKNGEWPLLVIGNGSNLLVKDNGIRGVVLCLTGFRKIQIQGNRVIAQGGALLSAVANEALKYSLKGMEFSSGIPGTVGGAVTMNAGAYGPEIKDVIECARVMDRSGKCHTLSPEELELGYRTSIIERKQFIVLEATFRLEQGDAVAIKNRMDELNHRRSDKQPLNYPSAGSTFKRPNGYFAAKLIEDTGLKGFRVGGAMVSEKHSGFIINYENSTSADILELIRQVSKRVQDKYDVVMEPEVRIIGED